MVQRGTITTTVERWSPVAFLVAGGLFAVDPVVTAVNAVTEVEMALTPAAVFTFMLIVFVGLLGLYPRLADRDSLLATGGLGLLAVTTATILPAIPVFLPSTEPPFGAAIALAIVVTVAVGATLTVATFGVACLLTAAHSRSVGAFLLVMAASMASMTVVMAAYGHSTPEWAGVVANGIIAASSGAIGYVLRTRNVSAESPTSTGDVAAD